MLEGLLQPAIHLVSKSEYCLYRNVIGWSFWSINPVPLGSMRTLYIRRYLGEVAGVLYPVVVGTAPISQGNCISRSQPPCRATTCPPSLLSIPWSGGVVQFCLPGIATLILIVAGHVPILATEHINNMKKTSPSDAVPSRTFEGVSWYNLRNCSTWYQNAR